MKQALHPLVLLLCVSSSAQNLVPNPGFEDMVRMPSRQGNQVTCTRHWRSPTGAGTDYYHFEADNHAGTPGNIFGRQEPHGGEAYAGICVKDDYMEHLAVTLRDTLKKDQRYLVEFYVSRADRSIGQAGEFGILFSDKKIYSFGEQGITERPSIDFTGGEFNRKGRWTKLSAVYEADGTEITLILGYFNYDPSKRCRTFCHYYIDDVSVTPWVENEEPLAGDGDAPPLIEEEMEEVAETQPDTFVPVTGVTITLKNIFFATNNSELLPASFPELDRLVKFLSDNGSANIEISGHTDNTGPEPQNIRLSEARAKAVADYLSLKAIDPTRISYKGYGSSRPVAGNDSEEGRQQNRRVEFTIREN